MAEYIVSETEFSQLKHDVKELRQGVQNTQNSLHRIEVCLMSDDELGRVGLVAQVKLIKSKVDEIDTIVKEIQQKEKTTEAVKKAKAIWFGSLGTLLMFLLREIWQIISKHVTF